MGPPLKLVQVPVDGTASSQHIDCTTHFLVSSDFLNHSYSIQSISRNEKFTSFSFTVAQHFSFSAMQSPEIFFFMSKLI